MNAEYGEWSILPIFLPPLVNSQQRAQMLGNQSETLQIVDLECGASYELFVKQPLNNWRSELITFRTQGQAPVTPRKTDVLQLANRTLSIQLSAWLQANPQSLVPTSAPLIFKHHSRMSAVDQSGEEFASQPASAALKEVKEKVNGCPIHRFMTEYRTSNAGLWKLLNVQPADPNSLQSVELALMNEKVIYTIRITAYTIGKPFAVAEYDVRLNEQGLADYDEFLVLDNEDITPMNINSRAVALDQHTMFSIICSTLILLALGFVLLLLLIQRKRLLMRSSAHPDKNASIYRKVINNGDTTASLLQSTIAYNRSVSSSIRQPIGNSSAAAALLSTAISSSNAITNSDSSTYVAAAAALQAVSSALNGANFSPRLSGTGNYNQCSKLANNIAQSGLNKQPINGANQVPELPSVPPPPLSCASKRSNQINSVYKQSTLNHRTLSKINSKDEEITPYATFTMQAEDMEPENAGDQLPAHIQELHEMHRQLSKFNQQQQQIKNSNSNYTKTNSGNEAISASVVDLFKSVKFGQSNTPQQFLKKQIDKIGISRSRTVVDREPSIESCSPSKKPLRKSHNLIYGEDSNGSTFNLDRLEKKLLEEEQNDLRMFSLKVGEPGYMRYCMESNQMIGGQLMGNPLGNNQLGNQLLAVEQHPHDILTPPASYLNTIDRNSQYKLINQLNLNQLNEINKLSSKINQINQLSQMANQQGQINASVKELNRPDSARAESADSACSASALYEFSCIFNKQPYDNQMEKSSGLMNSVQMNKLMNQQRPSNKNKNLIRLLNASTDHVEDGEERGSLISQNMINNMISNEQEADEEVTSAAYPTNDMLNADDASSQASSDEEETSSRQISEMNSSHLEHSDNCRGSSLTANYAGGLGLTANEANKNDDDNLKSNKQRNKTASNLGRLNQGHLNSIAEPNFKAISRGRSKRPSWTDMQTLLIADQKPSGGRKENGKAAPKSKVKSNESTADEKRHPTNQLKKQFKSSVNQGNFRVLSAADHVVRPSR